MSVRAIRFLMLSLAFSVWGCGSGVSDYPELGEVHGNVTLDGKPLSGAEVSFLPDEGRGSSGLTDSSGNYHLTYTDKLPGAKVGHHTVRITTSSPADSASKELLPDRYHLKSDLSFQVNKGKNVADFQLTTKTN